jgi:hypothetical protein
VFYEVDQDALALLRAAKEHHDWLEPGEPFSEVREPKAASLEGRCGLEPDTLRYERAVRYLVKEGALVWEQRLGGVPGVDLYRITQRGLEMLEAS